MLSFLKKNIIGVDIGSCALKIVQFKGGIGSYTLSAAVSVNANKSAVAASETGGTNAEVSGLIADIIRSKNLKPRLAASAMPPHTLFTRNLYLPVMPERDMKEAVKWEIRKEISFPPSELISGYVLAGSSAKSAENLVSIIAFGSRRSDVEKISNILKTAGLELRVADAVPMAMLAVFDINNDWEHGVNYAMIDIGQSRSTLAIFKEKKLCFAREITYGGADLTAALVDAMRKDQPEAELYKIEHGLNASDEEFKKAMSSSVEGLCAELQRSFDYYQAQFREGAVSKLFLSGGTATLKGIDEFISRSIGISAFRHDPFKRVKIPKHLASPALLESSPSLNVAAGLASRSI